MAIDSEDKRRSVVPGIPPLADVEEFDASDRRHIAGIYRGKEVTRWYPQMLLGVLRMKKYIDNV